MAHSKVYTNPKRSLWEFGTRAVVMAAIGAALYGVLSYLTNVLQIPSAANVSVRPAVALVFFFGLAFGPVVGFITGFLGNTIADLLSGYGFWIWWGIGNGLMGLVAGLFANLMSDFRRPRDLGIGEVAVILGTLVGMFVASLSEMWVSGIDFITAMATNFVPAITSNLIWGLILVPILLVAYSAIVRRSGR
jgi:energy-coupling factor transport system substrate-specific component